MMGRGACERDGSWSSASVDRFYLRPSSSSVKETQPAQPNDPRLLVFAEFAQMRASSVQMFKQVH